MFTHIRPHTIDFQEGLTPSTSQKWMSHYLGNLQYYEISGIDHSNLNEYEYEYGDSCRVSIMLFQWGNECLHTWDHLQYIFKTS